RAFVGSNDFDEAERVLEDGLAQFPHAGELERLKRLVRSHQLADRTQEVRRRLEDHPTPAMFHELVDLHLQCGDPAAAEVACADWRRLFPGDAGAELAQIKIGLRRFYAERAAADGRAAIAGLERLLQRDPGHARALRLMAEICSRIGALPRAQEALERLARIVPDDPGVAAWLRAVESALAGPYGKMDLGRALREVEEAGQFPDPVPSSDEVRASNPEKRRPPRQLDAARPALARLARNAGVRLVVLVRGSAALVRGAPNGGAEAVARATRAIGLMARRTTRRMGLGAFVEAVVETDSGVLLMRAGDSSSATAVMDSPANLERVRSAISDLAAAHPIDEASVGDGSGGVLVHA
ncbi:MAG TPA: tetratricopeptide repeat protein, partial [Planctomycetota bacterium]|nr:tetratricopeptide repeat protein [Planctomycetota bacterium]